MTQPQNQASANTLIFIPDISGFTRFVNETEINHAKHIIEELLEVLIDSDEYSLFSNELVRACSTWLNLEEVSWAPVGHTEEEYDFGMAKYCYIGLEALENHIPEPKKEDYSMPGLTSKFIECECVIEAPIDLVFDVLSDMSYRHEWLTHVKDSDQLNHEISQNGSSHRCVIKGDKSDPTMVAHGFDFAPNKITFVETNHRDKSASVWVLHSIGKGLTRLENTMYCKPNFFKKALFNLMMKKKYDKINDANLTLLKDYCKKLVKEGRSHPHQVVLPKSVMGVEAIRA
jgi:hypothetical protein